MQLTKPCACVRVCEFISTSTEEPHGTGNKSHRAKRQQQKGSNSCTRVQTITDAWSFFIFINIKCYTVFRAGWNAWCQLATSPMRKTPKKNKTQNLQLRVAHRAKSLVQQRFIVLMMGTNYWFIYFFSICTTIHGACEGVTCLVLQRMQTQNNSLPELIPQTLRHDCKCLITH